jgi:CRP/FNR family transcriptional regulator
MAFARALSANAKARLDAEASVRMVGPRTRLLERGDAAGGVFVVTVGALRVYYLHPRGREGTLYWVEPAQACFLSLDCAFTERPYPAWAESDDTPTQFVFIPAPLFRTLHDEEPAMQRFTVDALSGRVHELMNLVEQSATLALEQRAAALLLKLAEDGCVNTSQDRLANHLGTAREVMARLLRGFRAQGWIETRRGRVLLLAPEALRALAQPTPEDAADG